MSSLSIANRQKDAAPSVSFEFFPPKSEAMATRLWETVQRLEPMAPEFVSVTYGAGGSTRERTHDTVKRIASDTALRPAAHLTCVSATKAEVLDVADSYAAAGVHHIVALRGDPPEGMGAAFAPHPDGFANSVELIEALSEAGKFEISVSCYPEPHPNSRGWDEDLAFLKAKQDAGAKRAITQFFFEPDTYLRFVEKARAKGITMPLVPGIMLQPNFAGLKRMASMVQASVPAWLDRLYDGLDSDDETRDLVTATVAAELCHKLADEGVSDFHFYTLNRAGLALSTCRLLGMKPKPVQAA
ncbi:methylenetetrahydrofolate reductase [NAD(P)H] [Hyphomonas oceanitis]|uniref:methylenetetrahydrofolate reductase [NAD(P)H] n=1 Tax=Hyphomonas oceanitis TaxID=81033 RepID=UPI00300131CF